MTSLSPSRVAELLRDGRAVLIDVREPDEFARSHVDGARSHPLSSFEAQPLRLTPGKTAIFTCRSGMRTAANRGRLIAAAGGEACVLEGGVDGWAAAGLPLARDAKAPLELMRQVQLIAGSLVVTGVALGLLVHPAFLGLSAFVGAGLAFAGATGFCGMARLLKIMPWNKELKA